MCVNATAAGVDDVDIDADADSLEAVVLSMLLPTLSFLCVVLSSVGMFVDENEDEDEEEEEEKEVEKDDDDAAADNLGSRAFRTTVVKVVNDGVWTRVVNDNSADDDDDVEEGVDRVVEAEEDAFDMELRLVIEACALTSRLCWCFNNVAADIGLVDGNILQYSFARACCRRWYASKAAFASCIEVSECNESVSLCAFVFWPRASTRV